MRGSRAALAPAATGSALVAVGVLLPVAAAYVVGVLLVGAALAVALRGRVPAWAAVTTALAAAGLAIGVPLLTLPRTTGLAGEWAARAIEGEVLGARALVSRDNASIDLTTGKTVRLGSVTGGSRWVADDRMLVVRDDRVDSVRLDASARWTWRPSEAATIQPLAAADDSTVLRVCPASGGGQPCELVGVDRRGRRAWTTDAPGQTARTTALTGPAGSLPRTAVLHVQGSGGFYLVDPATGRRALVAGAAVLPVAEGPVVVAHSSGGRCVTTLYAGTSPAWTSVTESLCADAVPSRWFTASEHLWVERGGSWERYALDRGARTSVPRSEVPEAHQTSRLSAAEEQDSLRLNPFRSTDRVSVLALRDDSSGQVVARLVTEHPAELLLAEDGAVVVRQDDQVTRYTVDAS
jgi:hypothetical protein